jgi:HEPN domain-containing protein
MRINDLGHAFKEIMWIPCSEMMDYKTPKILAMNEIKSKTTLTEAEEMFNNAQEELCRPEEDVVHYNACKNAYKAIEKYMTGFLLNHGIGIQNSHSIQDLLIQCRKIDSKFNDLNLDYVMDAENVDKLMINLSTAKEFINLAGKTRKLVGLQ